MDQQFDPYKRNFASLSVADLLEARAAFHVHFAHITRITGTAIGLYLIRDRDPDAAHPTTADAAAQRGTKGERTLANSSVQKWSWPCILVFVDAWLRPEEFRAGSASEVPPFVYLPDGRVIPVCTVLSPPPTPASPRPLSPYEFTSYALAPGYPLRSLVQGAPRFGTAGCLATDGRKTYVMTSRHVSGAPGDIVSATVQGEDQPVGVASTASLATLDLPDVYSSFKATETKLNIDVGLVDVFDASQWTAQVYGVGTLGALVTFDTRTASLDWIGRKVVASGAASGRMEGEIRALFYRYKTVAGRDGVTDFLIGGRDKAPLPTRHGDSGTVWCIDPVEFGLPADSRAAHRPFAIQWGGVRLSAGPEAQGRPFALATSLAIVCRELDVDLVTDVDQELPQYWGATGHYKIAQLAIDRIANPALKAFFSANLTSISFDAAAIGKAIRAQDPREFVPLADVPDYVWKTNINRSTDAARPQENWTHYADMDLVGAAGHTLDAACGTPPVLDLAAWIAFYKGAPVPSASTSRSNNMGSLPFRVWQVFNEMLAARKAGSAPRFLAACGVLAHYIGDACQPLHGSIHSDGLDGARTGVHSAYEDKMIDKRAADLTRLLDAFKDTKLKPLGVKHAATGHQAGQMCIELMRRASGYLPPRTICRTYDRLGGGTNGAMLDGMWAALGDATVRCLADGRRVLAVLWNSAYESVPGKPFAGTVKRSALQAIYEKATFVESRHLANLKVSDYPKP